MFKTGDIMYGLEKDYERDYTPLGATKELAQKKLYNEIFELIKIVKGVKSKVSIDKKKYILNNYFIQYHSFSYN